MAKHIHRIQLNNGKTWRCTLDECNYFIHIGLAHILPGRLSKCWECGENFKLNTRALSMDQPICDDCDARSEGRMTNDEIEAAINLKLTLAKAGVKSVEELPESKRRMLTNFGILPKEVQKEYPPDEIDVIETYNPEEEE